jgi:hypothetical protein
MTPKAWRNPVRLVAINLAVLALLLSPLLGPWLLAHWALRHPRWAWGPLLELARWPYLNIYRQGIQGRKDCFQVDQTLTYIGQRQVKAKGYAGPVSVCAVRYTPIAGHRNRKPVQFMAQNKDIEVWLAPVGANRVLVPFRISMATMIGHLNIEADEFSAAAKAAP